ncbi:hypothetical protein Pelo_6024 [Pelomyxa schiedti]|nr:hypothetical protein Pelo_6024 [Pelomyxa schiedti]
MAGHGSRDGTAVVDCGSCSCCCVSIPQCASMCCPCPCTSTSSSPATPPSPPSSPTTATTSGTHVPTIATSVNDKRTSTLKSPVLVSSSTGSTMGGSTGTDGSGLPSHEQAQKGGLSLSDNQSALVSSPAENGVVYSQTSVEPYVNRPKTRTCTCGCGDAIVLLAHLFPVCQNFKPGHNAPFETAMIQLQSSGRLGDRVAFVAWLSRHPKNAIARVGTISDSVVDLSVSSPAEEQATSQSTPTVPTSEPLSEPPHITFELMLALMRNVFAHEDCVSFVNVKQLAIKSLEYFRSWDTLSDVLKSYYHLVIVPARSTVVNLYYTEDDQYAKGAIHPKCTQFPISCSFSKACVSVS